MIKMELPATEEGLCYQNGTILDDLPKMITSWYQIGHHISKISQNDVKEKTKQRQ